MWGFGVWYEHGEHMARSVLAEHIARSVLVEVQFSGQETPIWYSSPGSPLLRFQSTVLGKAVGGKDGTSGLEAQLE
jgi:hypothetical protein